MLGLVELVARVKAEFAKDAAKIAELEALAAALQTALDAALANAASPEDLAALADLDAVLDARETPVEPA